MRMVQQRPASLKEGVSAARMCSRIGDAGAAELSSRPAKSTLSARVRFQRLATVGEEAPRSIWLSIERDTPESCASASSERPRSARASFSRAARWDVMS